jgi:hypothetical protein
LVDPDVVEEANVTTQGYDDTYVGWDKVEATRSIIRKVNIDARVRCTKKKSNDLEVWPSLGVRPLVFASVDSIEGRKNIFEKFGVMAQLYVDPRMALEDLEVSFIMVMPGEEPDPKLKEYTKSLEETDHLDLPCSARSINYTGAAAAGLVLPQVRRWLLGLSIPYVIHANLGAGVVKPLWREGEKYTEEKFG